MKKNILIVVDMQNDFINGSLGTKEAKSIVPNVINKIKNFDGIVIYTRDTHYENYMETLEGKKLPVKHCIDGTDGWEIPDEIYNAGKDKSPESILSDIYDKPTFGCTDLADDVRGYYLWRYSNGEKDELEIEMIGLCTDICVISNALLIRAVLPDAIIKVDSSCCAGVTPETHEAALKTMQMCQIDVI